MHCDELLIMHNVWLYNVVESLSRGIYSVCGQAFICVITSAKLYDPEFIQSPLGALCQLYVVCTSGIRSFCSHAV